MLFRASWQEELVISRDVGDRRGFALALGSLGEEWALRGEPERAARLLGAEEALREGIDVVLQPHQREFLPRRLAIIRAQLDESALAAAWAAGRAMTLGQAVTEALALDGPSTAPTPARPDAGLTVRELEVLRLLAAGKSNPEIAEALALSVHTVIRHANHIFAKLGVQNRTEAAAYAHRHRLV